MTRGKKLRCRAHEPGLFLCGAGGSSAAHIRIAAGWTQQQLIAAVCSSNACCMQATVLRCSLQQRALLRTAAGLAAPLSSRPSYNAQQQQPGLLRHSAPGDAAAAEARAVPAGGAAAAWGWRAATFGLPPAPPPPGSRDVATVLGGAWRTSRIQRGPLMGRAISPLALRLVTLGPPCWQGP